ncbi:fatty acid desaturase [uncultured Roseovarius sp.]|uniref:fatty acid desaturase n=1 Tax=uncultured Roseovarius sp. TaxID=293344 RepID=UPI0026113BDA|nr:fatty acid desaturase [uncultured Roseovarius sp.]
MAEPRPIVEWPTLALLIACYAGWGLSVFWLSALWLPLGFVATVIFIALHSSLTHEMIHGHPFRISLLNEIVGFPCLGLLIPYRRFKDLHLAHHRDENLTDPYDDPESNYLDPEAWNRQPHWRQQLLRFNNTLLGRMLVGPVIGFHAFVRTDWRSIREGDRRVTLAWLLQVPAVAVVLWLVLLSQMPVWAYLPAAYLGYSIIKIRTFLEHRAHDQARGRTAIVEDRGILSFLFLNNNLHVVHHLHPRVAWYDLPALYRANRDSYLQRNDSYVYRSYAQIFRQHFWRAKDPVPHPLWPKR